MTGKEILKDIEDLNGAGFDYSEAEALVLDECSAGEIDLYYAYAKEQTK